MAPCRATQCVSGMCRPLVGSHAILLASIAGAHCISHACLHLKSNISRCVTCDQQGHTWADENEVRAPSLLPGVKEMSVIVLIHEVLPVKGDGHVVANTGLPEMP